MKRYLIAVAMIALVGCTTAHQAGMPTPAVPDATTGSVATPVTATSGPPSGSGSQISGAPAGSGAPTALSPPPSGAPAPSGSEPAPASGAGVIAATFTEASAPISMSGTLLREEHRTGSTLTVTVTFANKGAQPAAMPGCAPVLWLDILNGSDLAAGGKPPAHVPCNRMGLVLPAGGKLEQSASAVLPAAGSYTLVVHGWLDGLQSGPIPITVTAAQGATSAAGGGSRVASGQSGSLVATVAFPSQELKTNATVTVQVAVKNAGTSRVQLEAPVSTGLALMTIADKFGQTMGGNAAGGMRSHAIRLVTIDPGQSVTEDQQLVLPAGKGSYTFVAQIQGEQGLKTAPITLDVQ